MLFLPLLKSTHNSFNRVQSGGKGSERIDLNNPDFRSFFQFICHIQQAVYLRGVALVGDVYNAAFYFCSFFITWIWAVEDWVTEADTAPYELITFEGGLYATPW